MLISVKVDVLMPFLSKRNVLYSRINYSLTACRDVNRSNSNSAHTVLTYQFNISPKYFHIFCIVFDLWFLCAYLLQKEGHNKIVRSRLQKSWLLILTGTDLVNVSMWSALLGGTIWTYLQSLKMKVSKNNSKINAYALSSVCPKLLEQ